MSEPDGVHPCICTECGAAFRWDSLGTRVAHYESDRHVKAVVGHSAGGGDGFVVAELSYREKHTRTRG